MALRHARYALPRHRRLSRRPQCAGRPVGRPGQPGGPVPRRLDGIAVRRALSRQGRQAGAGRRADRHRGRKLRPVDTGGIEPALGVSRTGQHRRRPGARPQHAAVLGLRLSGNRGNRHAAADRGPDRLACLCADRTAVPPLVRMHGGPAGSILYRGGRKAVQAERTVGRQLRRAGRDHRPQEGDGAVIPFGGARRRGRGAGAVALDRTAGRHRGRPGADRDGRLPSHRLVHGPRRTARSVAGHRPLARGPRQHRAGPRRPGA